MTPDFAALFTVRLSELVADLRFTYQPDGSTRPPQIVETMLDPKEQGYQDGQELPLVRWVISGGEFARMRPAPFSVLIHAGIYTPGSIQDGSRDIASLAMALGRIVEKPWYKPYKLRNSVLFSIGSPNKETLGIQPHPYYWAELQLEFVVAKGHGG